MSLNILIIDDDFVNRKLLQALIKKSGIASMIIEAENGSEALSAIKENRGIDFILLDIIMPVLDGKEFLRIFRSDSFNNDIPVVVLTTDDSQKSIIFELGADDFLLKPVKEKELMEKIRKWSPEV